MNNKKVYLHNKFQGIRGFGPELQYDIERKMVNQRDAPTLSYKYGDVKYVHLTWTWSHLYNQPFLYSLTFCQTHVK